MSSKPGTITKWDDEKGFGFITPKAGGRLVFLHINDFSKKHQRPRQGLSVIYSLSKDKKGRLCASKVFPQVAEVEFTRADGQMIIALLLGILFMCALIGLILYKKLPSFLMIYYLAVSAVTFFIYATDKSAAKVGEWRTRESEHYIYFLLLADGPEQQLPRVF